MANDIVDIGNAIRNRCAARLKRETKKNPSARRAFYPVRTHRFACPMPLIGLVAEISLMLIDGLVRNRQCVQAIRDTISLPMRIDSVGRR